MKHIYSPSDLLLRWNRPNVNNMKRRKKNIHFSRSLLSSSSPKHKDMWMFKKARQSSHYKITKNVYMSSNIFVLYYIQLSLLKMEYRWLLYCRQGEKIATLHVTGRTVTWFSEVQFAVVWERKRWIGALWNEICSTSYLSFAPSLEQGFLPEHTDSLRPCNTGSENQTELRHFY